MATSQNGWPVVTDRSKLDTAELVPGITVPNGVLAGPVAAVARWCARRYAATVEPLHAGWCWGWYVKTIEGTTAISNHASATAWDFNAPAHPMGRPASDNMTAAQIAACRAIVAASGGVLRWGGDYTSRPDPMHWEIIATPARVAAFVAELAAPATVEIDGRVPILVKGARDQAGQTAWIWRAQRLLGVTDDGYYWTETAAALAKRMIGHPSSSSDGHRLGLPEWRVLYGLW